jgi:hypothetical protein
MQLPEMIKFIHLGDPLLNNPNQPFGFPLLGKRKNGSRQLSLFLAPARTVFILSHEGPGHYLN